jgi:hypothetical protein
MALRDGIWTIYFIERMDLLLNGKMVTSFGTETTNFIEKMDQLLNTQMAAGFGI